MTTEATNSIEADRIVRSIHIKAPRSRVWRALSDAPEYGKWFGVNLAGQTFAAGQPVKGPFTIRGHEHMFFEVVIDKVEPENLLSYRWHPNAVEANADRASEPTTLVTFTLKDAEGGTMVTVTETGFEHLPAARRLEAYRGNSKGWDWQMNNLLNHVNNN